MAKQGSKTNSPPLTPSARTPRSSPGSATFVRALFQGELKMSHSEQQIPNKKLIICDNTQPQTHKTKTAEAVPCAVGAESEAEGNGMVVAETKAEKVLALKKESTRKRAAGAVSNLSKKKPMPSPSAKATDKALCEEGSIDSLSEKKIKMDDATAVVKGGALEKIWTDDDDLVILQGVLGYQEKYGTIPTASTLLKSLDGDELSFKPNLKQLASRLRRLKSRYSDNLHAKMAANKLELKGLELAEKIWHGPIVNSTSGEGPPVRRKEESGSEHM